MKRLLLLGCCLLLVFGLCSPVSAAEGETRATMVQMIATVSADGSCQVTATVTLHLETPMEELTYPVPVNASSVTLNGSPVLTQKTEQARLVNLSKILGGMSGDFAFTVGYSIHSAVDPINSEDEEGTDRVQLELPLLAGFAYPIDQLQFSITVPAVVDQPPSFISGYHQANIEKDLNYTVSGGNIAGRSWTALKDHETLKMVLIASPEMFPQTRAELPSVDKVTPILYALIGAAFLYWLLFLRNWIPLREYSAVAPEGIGAGQLGSVLTMAGPDLGLMTFAWAQQGYVLLQMDRRGRVLLHKRMEMGNERTAFEQKCFHALFARRDVVDTTGTAFVRLYKTVAGQRTISQFLRPKGAGNVKLFRILAASAGALCGTCFGILLGNMLDYGWVFMSALAAVGLICSWQIQHWTDGVFLHHPSRLWMALGIGVLWLALGIGMGAFGLALLSVLIQLVAGLMAAFGGRRSEEGRIAMGQTLSLRSYLRTLSSRQITQLCQDNPAFFFDMLPSAMALGSERSFARRFGKGRLPECPYVVAEGTRGLTAAQWCRLMRQLLDGMTARQRQLPAETFRAVMRNYMK